MSPYGDHQGEQASPDARPADVASVATYIEQFLDSVPTFGEPNPW